MFITQGKTNLKYVLIVVILSVIVWGGILLYYYIWLEEFDIIMDKMELTLPEKKQSEGMEIPEFKALESAPLPPFIEFVDNAEDVKIDFYYEGEQYVSSWMEPEFYIPEDSNERFLSLSKTKLEGGDYAYGSDYNPIFSKQGSHWYGGSPIYLLDSDSKYSVSYVGFKFNDPSLISELRIEFGIDFFGGDYLSSSRSSVLSSVFGIESVYACGPGLYLRHVGSSDLTFVEEREDIAWYRLEKPVDLYDLNLNYCDQDCSSIPEYCHNWADDPPECWDYFCCYYNASISGLEYGNLRMHIFYKPNDKEGFLKLQVANLILSDPETLYYQPIMGQDFNHHYRAYLH